MSRRNSPARAARRNGKPEEEENPYAIQTYFNEKNADLIVRRRELWGTLEWFNRRVVQNNVWYRRLWRWLRGKPTRLDPWTLARMQHAKKELEAEREEDDLFPLRLLNLSALVKKAEERGDISISSGDHRPLSWALEEAARRLQERDPSP